MKPEMKKLIITNLPTCCLFTCSASWDRPTGWRLGQTCRKSYCTLRTLFPCL